MRTRLPKLGLIIALAWPFGLAGTAAHALNETGQASAIILPNLSAAVQDDLTFGVIVPAETQASTVTVSQAASDSSSCGVGLSCLETGNRAELKVRGAPGFRFSVTAPGSAYLRDGTGNLMLMDGFTIGGDGAASVSRLDANGTATLFIGATLHVGANQPAGAYAGSYTLTANYE